MTTFAPSAMSGLVDTPVLYDLAESTCPPLRVGELIAPDLLAGRELGYGTSRGEPELRELIAAGAGVDADDVLVTAGGISAMFLLALVLCEPGDEVVIATPCFPPTRAVPEALGVRLVPVPLAFDDGYRLDVEAIAAELTPATRLVSLASPQNPSGVRFRDEELLALIGRVEERTRDAVVLVDETYRETVYGERPLPASAARLGSRVVTCSSVSKSHGAPGLRVGWLTATEPELYERLRLAKFNALIACSSVDELLAAEVLRQADRILAGRRGRLAAALELLERWARERRELVELLRPDGGALCCLRLRGDRFDDAAVRRFHDALAERDARVARGSWFGESDHVFRLGFGHLPESLFAEALERLGDALTYAADDGPP